MSDNDKFVFESLQDPAAISGYLQSLIEGIDGGRINLATNGDEITLHPSGLIKITVKAQKKPQSSKLTLKLSWKDEADDDSMLQCDMTIDAG